VILCVLLTAVLSFSRGAWLGALVAILASVPLFFQRARGKGMVLIVVLAVLISATGLMQLGESIVRYRIGEYTFFKGLGVRQANYILSLQSASRHLLVGVGLGHYPEVYREFPDSAASQMRELWFAHSLFLTLIPEIGLLGTVAILYLFASHLAPGLRLYRSRARDAPRALAGALSVGVISYLVIASSAGGHLVSYLISAPGRTCFAAPAFVVACTFLGAIAGIRAKQQSARAAKTRWPQRAQNRARAGLEAPRSIASRP
jgi:O-antigen ligase